MSMSHFFSLSKLQKPITLSDFTAACGRSYVEKKHESSCFARFLSTMLPVPCHSEKINICWKVQIDDKDSS